MAFCGGLAFCFAGKKGGGERGVGQRGGYGIDSDFWRKLSGKGAGYSFDGSFGCRDGGVKGHACLHCYGGEEDDGGGGRFFEDGEGLLDGFDCCEGIDLEVGEEFFPSQPVKRFEVDASREVDEAI